MRYLFASFTLFVALTLAAWAGPGRWTVDQPSDPAEHGEWIGASIDTGGLLAAITYFPDTDLWYLRAGVPNGTPMTDMKSVLVKADGRTWTLDVKSDDLITHEDTSSNLMIVSYVLHVDDIELVQAASRWEVTFGGRVFNYPLTGTRKALDEIQIIVAAMEDDAEHSIVQALSDCEQQVAHPWDPGTDAGGRAWGQIDAEIAVSSCESAMASNPVTPQLQYLMGRAYDKAGDRRAFALIEDAALNGNYAMALSLLGIFYENGDWVAKDTTRAIRYYRRAASRGIVPAKNRLGRLLLREYAAGSPEAKRGKDELLEAASLGYPPSMTLAGQYLSDGTFGAPDMEEARRYLELAVEAGERDAAYRLAELYRDGAFGTPDPNNYLHYLKTAADAGHEEARKELGLN